MKIIFIILLIILLILSALLICVSSMASTIANKKIFIYYGNKRGGGIAVDIIKQLYSHSHLPKILIDIPQEYYMSTLASNDIEFSQSAIAMALDPHNDNYMSQHLLINNYVVSKFIFDKNSKPYTYFYFTKKYPHYLKMHFNETILQTSQHIWNYIIDKILNNKLKDLSTQQLDSFKKHYDTIDYRQIDSLKEYCEDICDNIMKNVQLNRTQEDIFDKFLKAIFLNNGLEYGRICLIALLILLDNIPDSILDNRPHSVELIIEVFIKKTIQFDLMIYKFYNILDKFILNSIEFTFLDTALNTKIANMVIENILESFDKYVLAYEQLFDAYIIFIRDSSISIKSIMASHPDYILNIYIIAEYIESAEVKKLPNSAISKYITIFKKYYNIYWHSILIGKTISFLEYGYIDTTTNVLWVNMYMMYNFIIVNFIECKIIKNILTMIGAIIYYISIDDMDNANSIKDEYLAIILSICENTVTEFNVNTVIEFNVNSDIEISMDTDASDPIDEARLNCYFYKKRISLLQTNKEIMHSKYISAIEDLKKLKDNMLSITDLIDHFEIIVIKNIINIIIFFKMYLWMNQNIKLLEYIYMLDTKLLLENGINTHRGENENSISQKVLLIGNNNNNNYGPVHNIYKCFGVYNIYSSNHYLVDQNFWYSCTNWEDSEYWDNLNAYLGTKKFNALYIDKDSESDLNEIAFTKTGDGVAQSSVGRAFIRCISNHLSNDKCVIFVKIETDEKIKSPIYKLIYKKIIIKRQMENPVSPRIVYGGVTYLPFIKGNIQFISAYNDILDSIDYKSFNDDELISDTVVEIHPQLKSPTPQLESMLPQLKHPTPQLELQTSNYSPFTLYITRNIPYGNSTQNLISTIDSNTVAYWDDHNTHLGTKKFNALYIDKDSESDLNKIAFTKTGDGVAQSSVGRAFIRCISNHLSSDKCVIFVKIETDEKIKSPIYKLIYKKIIIERQMKNPVSPRIVYGGVTYLPFIKGNITLPVPSRGVSILGYMNSISTFITDIESRHQQTTDTKLQLTDTKLQLTDTTEPMRQRKECNQMEKQLNDILHTSTKPRATVAESRVTSTKPRATVASEYISTEINAYILHITRYISSSSSTQYLISTIDRNRDTVAYWDDHNTHLGNKKFNALYIDKDSESDLNEIAFTKTGDGVAQSSVGRAFIRCISNHLSNDKCVIFVKIETDEKIKSPIYKLIYKKIIIKRQMENPVSPRIVYGGVTYLPFIKGNIAPPVASRDVSILDYMNSISKFITGIESRHQQTTDTKLQLTDTKLQLTDTTEPMLQSKDCNQIERRFNDILQQIVENS